MEARPFIKWAGGKKQLLVPFQELYPKSWFSYFEPFIGGGAVFFDLWHRSESDTGMISDLNPRLIETYCAIGDQPRAVADALEVLQAEAEKNPKESYYNARRRFNDAAVPQVELASLFIYLNKNGYNGLFRVNKKGGFNVPWGHRKKLPALPSYEDLKAVADVLQHYEIMCAGYLKVMAEFPEKEDFVYLDPPYVPLSSTANFTAYTAGGFGDLDQRTLAKVFQDLTARGVQVMLSNHDTPELRKLYSDIDCHITVVPARRSINRNGAKRGNVNEVVIRNYR